MKIAFHTYQLGERGTEVMIYNYAKYCQEILGHEALIVSTSTRPTPGLKLFQDKFQVLLYDEIFQSNGQNEHLRRRLEGFVSDQKIDALFSAKGGENDNILPTNCKTWAHPIFRMDQPHGDVYAGVCKYIADKHGGTHPHVFPIIENPNIVGDLREELGIPKDAFVFGRHGGKDTFSLSFTPQVIAKVLEKRSDCYFLFLNTDKFINHDKVIHLPMTVDFERKFKFINTCDAMLHSRLDGEIFSQAVAEFSISNKPIITWSGIVLDQNDNQVIHPSYDVGHVAVLKNKGIYYHGPSDLENILSGVTKKDLLEHDWDVYKDRFSPKRIMHQFENVFIKELNNSHVEFLEDQEEE